MYIDLPEELEAVAAGEAFGKVLSGEGQTEDLVSPMNGTVVEMNHQANTAVSALVRDNLSEGWLLWLARIQPLNL
jgi:glycine cleavage system H lipoate-binding protein